jgi:hypothetical protein
MLTVKCDDAALHIGLPTAFPTGNSLVRSTAFCFVPLSNASKWIVTSTDEKTRNGLVRFQNVKTGKYVSTVMEDVSFIMDCLLRM